MRNWEKEPDGEERSRRSFMERLLNFLGFVAEEAGIPPWVANRCMNLLAVLGFLEKLPSTGGGDRWRVLAPNLEDVLKRWEALGRPSLREFNRRLVAERLGEDVAARVFRR